MEYEASSGYQLIKEMHGEYYLFKLKDAYHRANILPLLKKACQGIANPRILEFGPGMGVMAEIILKEIPDAEYHAVDIDKTILEGIEKKNGNVTTHLCCSFEELAEVKLADMDAVIALDVWEHLSHDDLDNYTRYAIDALKPGGIFIAQVPNWACPYIPNIVFASDLTHRIFFTEVSARQLMRRNGVSLDCVKILPYKFPAGLVGKIRTVARSVMLFFYRLYLMSLGVQRVSVMTPNILIVFRKPAK